MATALQEIVNHRESETAVQQVMFQVSSLYGISSESVRLPLSRTEFLESGQVCLTIDSEGDASGNVGIIDYEKGLLKVKYNAQIVFPGLYELVTSGKHDPSLLNPIRATATDECTLTPDLKGWRALGCLEFLPGSLWSGAKGG
jgi:hypothetical protein